MPFMDGLALSRMVKEKFPWIEIVLLTGYEDFQFAQEAIRIGVTPEEVKNRLPQSYTFKDIDAICEDLQSYKISVNKLPFRMNENIKVKTTESKHEPILPANVVTDDDVDSSLIEMAGLI